MCETDKSKEVKDESGPSYFLIITIILAIGAVISMIFKYYKRHGKVTNKKKKFNFIEKLSENDTWHYEYEGNVVVRCEKIGGFRRILRRIIPFPELGIWKLQDLMSDLYGKKFGGKPKFKVPNDVLTISIPRTNFKCTGKNLTDFEPKDGVQGGDYTYEMYCSSVQITWFHYENQKYIAGICIYMDNRYHPLKIIKEEVKKAFKEGPTYYPNPRNFKEKLMRKVWCSFRNQWIIITQNEFGEIDKFVFNGQENQMEIVKCTDCSLDPPVQLFESLPISKKSCSKPLPTVDFSKFLKVEFCEKVNDLVMIGRDSNSKIAHFNWTSDIGKFKIQSCLECENNAKNRFLRLEGEDDEPPSYEFLELIELTRD